MILILYLSVPVFIISLINVFQKNNPYIHFWKATLIISSLYLLFFITVYLVVWNAYHPKLDDYDKLQVFKESDWSTFFNYKSSDLAAKALKFKNKFEIYINSHSDVAPSIKEAMRNFTIIKGMDQEQVILVIGNPAEKIRKTVHTSIWKTSEVEIWEYHPLGILKWAFPDGQLTFKDGILIEIQARR